MTNREAAVENARNRKLRKERRAEYINEVRERRESVIALIKYCKAAGYPIAFRKKDLIALRKP